MLNDDRVKHLADLAKLALEAEFEPGTRLRILSEELRALTEEILQYRDRVNSPLQSIRFFPHQFQDLNDEQRKAIKWAFELNNDNDLSILDGTPYVEPGEWNYVLTQKARDDYAALRVQGYVILPHGGIMKFEEARRFIHYPDEKEQPWTTGPK